MYRRVIIAAFLTVTTFLIAHIVNLMVAHALTRNVVFQVSKKPEDVPPHKVNLASLTEAILASGVFGGMEVSNEKMLLQAKEALNNADPRPSTEPPIDAAKKIKLIGTVVGDGQESMAVVEEIGTNKQILYHLHDRVPNVGQIAQIRKDAVLIRQGAQHELVELAYTSLPPHSQLVATPVSTSVEVNEEANRGKGIP